MARAHYAPTTDQGLQQSRERGDRPQQPHPDGMNKTAAFDRGSAAPSSSPASAADRVRATESLFTELAPVSLDTILFNETEKE